MKNQYANRKFVLGGLLVLIGLVYIIRLFQLQILDTSYRLSANNNVLTFVPQHPARGLIYDRNGELIVYNEAAYDLMVVPSQVSDFDTIDLCETLKLKKETLIKKLQDAKNYSRYVPSPVVTQISSVNYAKLQEKLYKYPGFYVQPRTLRRYSRNVGAHILGYVGEVDEKNISKNSYYKLGDYIGISGIEKSYETALRGRKGLNIYLVDVHSRRKGPYQNGRFDTVVIVGSDLTACFDVNLQEYGEKLMLNKIGSIVAIEPSTGEVLSLISSPTYKPSMLIGRIRSENYLKLMQDTLKPLFNRALMASYPPGSTFKTINGLIGLQEKVLFPNTSYSCNLGYYARGVHVGCHAHDSPLMLIDAVKNSCNSYFCNVFRSILDDPKFSDIHDSFQNWRNHLLSFGLGQKLGTDFPNELNGFIPEASYFDRYYGEKGWSSLTLISLSIGQGEIGLTPLQMANMTAVIANRGYYLNPHIVRSQNEDNLQKHYSSIDSSYYSIIIEGMDLAVNGIPGTGSTARIARIDSIVVCGKTGTAQNPHGDDHSVFIAFAPKDKPQIAIAVLVENGGYGATYAAPIASLMIEKYLKESIKRKWLEDYILNTDLIHEQQEN